MYTKNVYTNTPLPLEYFVICSNKTELVVNRVYLIARETL